MVTLATAGLIRLIGRFHPLAIHFPIALLFIPALLEFIGIFRRKVTYPDATFVCLAAGAFGALVSAALGWADAASLQFGPEDAAILATHRWIGTFVAVSSVAAALLLAGLRGGRFPALKRAYLGTLFVTALAVGVGAHFGGILVYGRDYYSSAFSDQRVRVSGPMSLQKDASRNGGQFDESVFPLFRLHCIRCHGPRKQNGHLRLDSREAVLMGGKSGSAVVPGDGAHSLLFRAITDPNPDTRMPQDSPPLTEGEIRRIRAWIDQGAY